VSGKTATDRLCELLDENDEYYSRFGNRVWWGRPIDAQTGEPINVFHNIAEPAGGDRLRVELQLATPEQAIAATLGAEDTYTREECEASFVRGYSLGCLPSGSDPQWDENRQTVDEHMSDLGWVRKESALGHDRDAIYDAGFSSGVKATLQQLEGKIANHAGIVEIEEWIDEQWEDE
jgi:hypothetical protein